MSCRAGFVWATPQHFNRFIEECGISCELVTPHMLSAPFYRGEFTCLIIPTGFGNPQYSNLLPALRASSARIRQFVEKGGNLLVFGAATDKPDTYDWLPFPLTYRHDCYPRQVTCSPRSEAGSLVEDYDSSCIECDGIFVSHDGNVAGTADGLDVIVEKQVGAGNVVVTSVHELPSRSFLKKFCCTGTRTTF